MYHSFLIHVSLLSKLHVQLPHDLTITFLGIYPREFKTYVHTTTFMQIFTAVFFVIAQTGGNSDVLQQVKVLTNCGIAICDTTWQETSNNSKRPINITMWMNLQRLVLSEKN